MKFKFKSKEIKTYSTFDVVMISCLVISISIVGLHVVAQMQVYLWLLVLSCIALTTSLAMRPIEFTKAIKEMNDALVEAHDAMTEPGCMPLDKQLRKAVKVELGSFVPVCVLAYNINHYDNVETMQEFVTRIFGENTRSRIRVSEYSPAVFFSKEGEDDVMLLTMAMAGEGR